MSCAAFGVYPAPHGTIKSQRLVKNTQLTARLLSACVARFVQIIKHRSVLGSAIDGHISPVKDAVILQRSSTESARVSPFGPISAGRTVGTTRVTEQKSPPATSSEPGAATATKHHSRRHTLKDATKTKRTKGRTSGTQLQYAIQNSTRTPSARRTSV